MATSDKMNFKLAGSSREISIKPGDVRGVVYAALGITTVTTFDEEEHLVRERFPAVIAKLYRAVNPPSIKPANPTAKSPAGLITLTAGGGQFPFDLDPTKITSMTRRGSKTELTSTATNTLWTFLETPQEIIAKIVAMNAKPKGPGDVTLNEVATALHGVQGGMYSVKIHSDGSGGIYEYDNVSNILRTFNIKLASVPALIASLKPKPEPDPLQASHDDLLDKVLRCRDLARGRDLYVEFHGKLRDCIRTAEKLAKEKP